MTWTCRRDYSDVPGLKYRRELLGFWLVGKRAFLINASWKYSFARESLEIQRLRWSRLRRGIWLYLIVRISMAERRNLDGVRIRKWAAG